MNDHVIVSKAHTRKTDPFILLWAPNNSGYRFRKEVAGVYTEDSIKQMPGYYNNNDQTIAVPVAALERYWVRSEELNARYLDEQGLVLPNTKEMRAHIRKHRSKHRPKKVTP